MRGFNVEVEMNRKFTVPQMTSHVLPGAMLPGKLKIKLIVKDCFCAASNL